MKRSFKLITVLGIPIDINVSWFVILALVILTLSQGYFPLQLPGFMPYVYWIIGLITALLMFACLLLHELAHSIVAKRNKLPISGITLFVFGGVAHMEKEPATPKVEFKMAVAGPLMSIALAMFFSLLSFLSLHLALSPLILAVTDYLAFLNLAIAVFNMIPGFPLDGGRILRALLWHFTKSLRTATHIATFFGKIFAMVLMGLGFISLISSNFVSGVWFIFLGFFLLEAAEVSYRQVVVKRALSGYRVKDIMSKNVVFVPPELRISDLMDKYFFRYRHNCFPVIEGNSLLGVITFHDAKALPKEEWGNKTAKDILIPVNQDLLIKEGTPVIDALTQLANNTLGRLLVIEGDKMVGIVSQRDIMQLFEFRSEAAD